MTEDPSDYGTVEVTLTLEPADPSSVQPVSVTYTIELNRCHLDTIDTTTIISDFEYSIDSGPSQIGPNLNNEFAECPVSYKLT